ncbi:MAG: NAD-glutamate dehydrogenase [Dactylosporangium sp.]|nr:NAD-glutamate dehydrogenase [Dactylosporangium sp.]NNJ59459.1 NAD-glutamate dehydrogenase [Dactylosporangium sp.]
MQQTSKRVESDLPNIEHVVAECVGLAGTRAEDQQLGELLGHYWRFVGDEDLLGRTPASMVAATAAHRDLAAVRHPGEVKLRLTPASGDGHTIIEIVTDDMPFLVDSVTAAVTARDLDMHLRVHPVFGTRRTASGTLVHVRPAEDLDNAQGSDTIESWIRIEVDSVGRPEPLAEIRADLLRVLADVRRAVEDWPEMRTAATALAETLTHASPPTPDRDGTDAVDLLRWLVDDHFTFVGYRRYELAGPDGDRRSLAAAAGSGLGILRDEEAASPRPLSSLIPQARAGAPERRLLTITKANVRSTVHRASYLDYLGFRVFDAEGRVVAEHRFLGLLATTAYQTSVRDLPVIRRKVSDVMERSGLSARSHSGKHLMKILEAYPRDELFQVSTESLYQTVLGVLRQVGRRRLRLFVSPDVYGRFISCLVYLPRDRFTTANQVKIADILCLRLNGIGVDTSTRATESHLARMYLIVRIDPANPPGPVDVEAIAAELSSATQSWGEDLRLVLAESLGEGPARVLHARYHDALPEAYRDEHTAKEAAKDVAKFELLDEPGQLEMHVYRRREDPRNVRFKVYRHGEPMTLSALLPVLHSLGVSVSDERPYEVHRADATVYLYDFGLQLPDDARALEEIRTHLENAFFATWHGEAEVDGFNALVLNAGLTWRQVVVLRAYAKYLRQAGTRYSQDYLESTFRAHPDLAALLVALFEARLDPRARLVGAPRQARCAALTAAIERRLDAVNSLDEDRIIRAYRTLIQATLRTSFFQRDRRAGRPKTAVAFKMNPQAIEWLPAPRPPFEIFVYSPQFEGVHLRFGPVARGGLRWSDRREDFRTEILGLVKAQMVKNAVIVPTGAKGGFVLKTGTGRDAAIACYQQFIAALLDVTDNLVNGTVVGPDHVVRHDGDDPYLVVAADKGTATFSDLANAISVERRFWLGDAFASGGSTGYDHKRMGITARGAWESVRRVFRDLGRDIQHEAFTAVGIGDMSGDVFGNGLRLSRHTRLVAAFDHRHVFIDPTPDAATSYAERNRLFGLPRSSWNDYDRTLLSSGGGVWPRSAKSIPVSAEMRLALGLGETTRATLTPAEVVRAILAAPVDLLFNGGIGTYVKAAAESHAAVGDKANDHVRVDGSQLRCLVVGEGGNLGLTQRGRVEYALAGGMVATDFIDNAAGVDCSDHEVNIKVMLERAIGSGDLPRSERDALLAAMTDEVAALVLRGSYHQAMALGHASVQARALLPVHRRMITMLERRGQLDRGLEGLPSDEALAGRAVAGKDARSGLTASELAVLLSYVKILAKREILDSPVPDETWTGTVLTDYFPQPLRQPYAETIADHPLRREIVATRLVNEAVDRGGISFVFRAVEETGCSVAEVLRAYVVVREIFDLPDLWRAVEALDNTVPAAAQTAACLEVRRLLDRSVRWLVTNRHLPLDVSAEIARLRPGIAQLVPTLPALIQGQERAALRADADLLIGLGLPSAVAGATAQVKYAFGLLDIVATATIRGRDVAEVAAVYFALSARLGIDDLLSMISSLPREDRWQTMARMALRYDLYAALARLTETVLASTRSGEATTARVLAWEQANLAAVGRTRAVIADLGELGEHRADLASLSVLLRQIRTL